MATPRPTPQELVWSRHPDYRKGPGSQSAWADYCVYLLPRDLAGYTPLVYRSYWERHDSHPLWSIGPSMSNDYIARQIAGHVWVPYFPAAVCVPEGL